MFDMLQDYIVVINFIMLQLVGQPCDPTSTRWLLTNSEFALVFVK